MNHNNSTVALPTMPRHEYLDTELRQRARNLSMNMLVFCQTATEFVKDGHFARFGFEGPEEYFEERIGISYRSVRRWIVVAESFQYLPPEEVGFATVAIAELGVAKASILAPVLKQGSPWRYWVKTALEMSRDALQEAVSKALGAKPRGPARPGDAFLRYILAKMPDEETREQVERIFQAVFELSGSENGVGAFLLIIAEAEGGISQQLVLKRKGGAGA